MDKTKVAYFIVVFGISTLCLLPTCVPKPMTYRDYVYSAQCQARCSSKYGIPTRNRTIEFYNLYNYYVCNDFNCRQCSIPCDMAFPSLVECKAACKAIACNSSCEVLFKELAMTNSSKELPFSHEVVHASIGRPTVVCKYTSNHGSEEEASLARIYLRWKVTHMPPYDEASQMFFVVSIGEPVNKEDIHWRTLGKVRGSYVPVMNLTEGATYRFKVTAVSSSGIVDTPKYSDWITTLKANTTLTPPELFAVSEPVLYNNRPSVVVSWDPGPEPMCFFKIFWMSNDLGQEELKAPPEFRYRIKKLEFDSNYTVKLYSYDEHFRHGSHDAALSFKTPTCLEATHHDLKLCAPDPPRNLSYKKDAIIPYVANESHLELANVTLLWNPPGHSSDGRDVRHYEVEWRKETPIYKAPFEIPDSGSKIVKTTQTSIDGLHYNTIYKFQVYAVSEGGRSKSAELPVKLGPTKVSIVQGSSTVIRLKSGEILAITLVPLSLLLPAMVIVVVLCMRRRRRVRKYLPERHIYPGPVEEVNPIYDHLPALPVCETTPLIDKYETDFKRLTLLGVIGEGAFGRVMKAELSSLSEKSDEMIVAVKMLKDHATPDERRNLLLEIDAMKQLGHHPHIVSMIGCCTKEPFVCLIMDFCPFGDLRNYLRQFREKLIYRPTRECMINFNRSAPLGSDSGVSHMSQNSLTSASGDAYDEEEDLTETQLLSYGRQIAMGMEYLSEKKFIHRDLAARNILMLDKKIVKISDFGLTRDVYETNVYQPTSARKLPYKWMAIEALLHQKFTTKSDVWSFGVVLWEIVTLGGSPYPSVPMKDLFKLLNEGYRMEAPENCSPQIYQLMLSCWHPSPASRPSFRQLKEKIETLLEATQCYIDLSIEVSDDYFTTDCSSTSDDINSPETEISVLNTDTNRILCADVQDISSDAIDADSCCHGDEYMSARDIRGECRYCRLGTWPRQPNVTTDTNLCSYTDRHGNSNPTCAFDCNASSLMMARTPISRSRLSFKESLRNFITKVSKAKPRSHSAHRKRSISLTEVGDSDKYFQQCLSSQDR